MSDIVSCFGLCADTSSLDGVLCNRCKTPLLNTGQLGKKSGHVSCERVQNFYAWDLNAVKKILNASLFR